MNFYPPVTQVALRKEFDRLIENKKTLQDTLQKIEQQADGMANAMWTKTNFSVVSFVSISTIAFNLLSLKCWEAVVICILLGLVIMLRLYSDVRVSWVTEELLKTKVLNYNKLEKHHKKDVDELKRIAKGVLEGAGVAVSVVDIVEERISLLHVITIDKEFLRSYSVTINVAIFTSWIYLIIVSLLVCFRPCKVDTWIDGLLQVGGKLLGWIDQELFEPVLMVMHNWTVEVFGRLPPGHYLPQGVFLA